MRMARNLTIVHMDDEYADMISIYPMTFSFLVCTHWIESEGRDDAYCMAEEVRDAFPGEDHVKLFQFDCPVQSGAVYRYIFCGGTELPKKSNDMIRDCHTLFIVDILRQSSSGTGAEVVAQTIIDGLKQNNGALTADITLFTALQGPEAERIVNDNPGIDLIRKLDVEALESRLEQVFKASLKDV